jgi:hypothetical protein
MTEPLWERSRTKRNSWSSPITANRRRISYRAEETPETYVGYTVRDPEGRRMGSVRKFFANAYGEPEYIRVRTGLFGLKSFLIPICFVAVDEERRTVTLQ